MCHIHWSNRTRIVTCLPPSQRQRIAFCRFRGRLQGSGRRWSDDISKDGEEGSHSRLNRLLYHSTLGSRVIEKKKKKGGVSTPHRCGNVRRANGKCPDFLIHHQSRECALARPVRSEEGRATLETLLGQMTPPKSGYPLECYLDKVAFPES